MFQAVILLFTAKWFPEDAPPANHDEQAERCGLAIIRTELQRISKSDPERIVFGEVDVDSGEVCAHVSEPYHSKSNLRYSLADPSILGEGIMGHTFVSCHTVLLPAVPTTWSANQQGSTDNSKSRAAGSMEKERRHI